MKLTAVILAAICLMAAPLLAQDEGTTDITVVTPGGSERDLLDTPDAVSVLDRRDLDERARGQFPDMLEGVTGVWGQHTAHGQGSPFVRGLTGKQVLVLIDGVRFNNSTFRFGPNQYTSSINPDSIERVEIVRGPVSVLYGSDAQGGVINVITKKPTFSEFDYSFGARGRFESASSRRQAGLFGEVGSQNFGALANATYADVDELVGGRSIGRQPFTAYEEWGAFGTFGASFGDHEFIATYSHFQQNDVERTDKVSTLVANPALLPAPGEAQEERRRFVYQIDDMAILRWNFKPEGMLDQFFVDVSYHKQQETLERINRNSSTLRDQNYNVHTLGMNAQGVLNFGPLARLTVGAEAYHDIVHSRRDDVDLDTGERTANNDSAAFPDWSGYTTLGIYAQNETALIDEKLRLRYGVRWSLFRAISDVHVYGGGLSGVNDTFSDITGAVALIGRPVEQLSLTLNLARGFRAPNLDDLAASKGTGRGEQIPNPGLDPETQWVVDLGAKVFIPTVDSRAAAPFELRAGVNFFFSYHEDLMISVPTTFQGEDVVRLENEGRARIFGVEAETEFYLSQALGWFGLPTDQILFEGDALGVKANLTWTRGDDLKNDVPVHRIPPLFSEVAVRYEAMWGDVYVEPYMTIVGRQDQYAPSAFRDVRFTPGDAPGYVLFGLRSGWYPKRNFHINLNIENIGNRSYHPMASGTFGAGTNVILSGEIRW